MGHRSRLFALVLVPLAVACNTSPPPESQPPTDEDEDAAPPTETDPDAAPDDGLAGIRFAASEADADSESFQEAFGLLAQRDIYAVFDVPEPDGIAFVRMDILNPQDVLHQTIWRAISTDADAPEKAMHPEIGQELAVTQVEAANGRVRLDIAIPIAGTVFTEFSLTGTYSAKAWVGMGDGTPLVTGQFTLIQ